MVLLLCMRLTSVFIVLGPGNIRERRITIIIESCRRSTSRGHISLFVIKEQIKDLFLYQCPVFWIKSLRVFQKLQILAKITILAKYSSRLY